MQDKRVQDVYRSYFNFNKQRTLSTDLPSELSVTDEDGCTIFVDKTRRYDNQIVIRDFIKPERLETHLHRFQDGCSPDISIEPQANSIELEEWLSNCGYAPAYEHEFLQLSASSYVAPKVTTESVTVERWGQNHVDDFLALLKTSGLTCTDEVWRKKRSLYCSDTFRCFVAKVDGKPCAWATSFIENGHAILANAYTQESHRAKGCQTALLRARIEDANELDVQMFLTDVLPHTTSSKNCKSIGFTSVGIRSVWSRS
jgi:hypothetical protein